MGDEGDHGRGVHLDPLWVHQDLPLPAAQPLGHAAVGHAAGASSACARVCMRAVCARVVAFARATPTRSPRASQAAFGEIMYLFGAFLTIIVGYALMANLLFGHRIKNFHNFPSSLSTLLQITIGACRMSMALAMTTREGLARAHSCAPRPPQASSTTKR